jgi:SNF family Na+-dependent transporter
MVETFLVLILSFLLGAVCLVLTGWLVASGQFTTFDGLFLTLVCLVLALVFFLNCIWALRSQELLEWVQSRKRKKPEAAVEKPAEPGIPEKQNST